MARCGSLINQMYSNAKSPVPVVGMGATECGWSDRSPYTVVEVISPRLLVLQGDTATRTDNNGMSDCQSYTYAPNPACHPLRVSLRKDGRWRRVGSGKGGSVFLIGKREAYYDYSF